MSARQSLLDLEAVFGGASDGGFGSAVFQDGATGEAEDYAKACYRRFVGKGWDRQGESAWMTPWKQVLVGSGAPADIVKELSGIEDREARRSAALLVEGAEDPAAAEATLRAAFATLPIEEYAVYRVGDGAAMSGVLLVASLSETGGRFVLVFLMD